MKKEKKEDLEKRAERALRKVERARERVGEGQETGAAEGAGD